MSLGVSSALAFCMLLCHLSFEGEAAVVNCEPNLRIVRGCNICTCSDDGSQLSCIQQPCSSPPPSDAVSGDAVVCRAGTTFHAKCNICRCSTLGTDIGCTRKLCIEAK